MSARAAAAAAGHKEVTVRSVSTRGVTIEINELYGDSPLGAADLTTCFRVEPPSTTPPELPCPKYPTY
jgi:hypothetical protein